MLDLAAQLFEDGPRAPAAILRGVEVANGPVLVPAGIPTSLGSGIFALLSAGIYDSVEEAQKQLCLTYQTYLPQPAAVAVYDQLFTLYKSAYFALGQEESAPAAVGSILPELRRIAADARK